MMNMVTNMKTMSVEHKTYLADNLMLAWNWCKELEIHEKLNNPKPHENVTLKTNKKITRTQKNPKTLKVNLKLYLFHKVGLILIFKHLYN
jgi:hypothetical protein